VEEVATVGPFFDFRDLSTPAGEFDVIADLDFTFHVH
jgi:hypothetical protein